MKFENFLIFFLSLGKILVIGGDSVSQTVRMLKLTFKNGSKFTRFYVNPVLLLFFFNLLKHKHTKK